MKAQYFLTGTDTEIGKTFVTCALLQKAAQKGLRAAGIKAIAAGVDENGRNEDVEQIRAASNVSLAPAILNPYCFPPPIAPHIAAKESSVEIEFPVIQQAIEIASTHSDFLIVEGAGGFRVPLGENRDTADLAVHLQLPIILVVGMRLGCINHALSTAESIVRRGLPIAGWVANQIDPKMSRIQENFDTLKHWLNRDYSAACLGHIPFLTKETCHQATCAIQLPV